MTHINLIKFGYWIRSSGFCFFKSVTTLQKRKVDFNQIGSILIFFTPLTERCCTHSARNPGQKMSFVVHWCMLSFSLSDHNKDFGFYTVTCILTLMKSLLLREMVHIVTSLRQSYTNNISVIVAHISTDIYVTRYWCHFKFLVFSIQIRRQINQ